MMRNDDSVGLFFLLPGLIVHAAASIYCTGIPAYLFAPPAASMSGLHCHKEQFGCNINGLQLPTCIYLVCPLTAHSGDNRYTVMTYDL